MQMFNSEQITDVNGSDTWIGSQQLVALHLFISSSDCNNFNLICVTMNE